MQKPKLDVFVAFLTFGGNGGVSTIIPSHSDWLAETALKAKSDDRIGRFDWGRFGDIPLDVERNKIVQHAKDRGYDVLIMLDSDNFVDKYVGSDPNAKRFWDSSFDFLYERYLRQLPTVVCCPYCGPPPDDVKGGMENVYVFHFANVETPESDAPRSGIQLSAYTREHASLMKGIQPIGAGPTGVIMYSMDAFDLFPPVVNKQLVLDEYREGRLTGERAIQLLNRQGWFFYETNHNRTRKESTEDVTNTREIQLAGMVKHGQPVVFCNWDAWAGHWKPKCVGKPTTLPIEAVSEMFQEAVRNNVSIHAQAVDLNFGKEFDFSETPIMDNSQPVKEETANSVVENSAVLWGRRFDGMKHTKSVLEILNALIPVGSHYSVAVLGKDARIAAWACAAERPMASVFCCGEYGESTEIQLASARKPESGLITQVLRSDVVDIPAGSVDAIVYCGGDVGFSVVQKWLESPRSDTLICLEEAESILGLFPKLFGEYHESTKSFSVPGRQDVAISCDLFPIAYGMPSVFKYVDVPDEQRMPEKK